jgi:hypothetical protein
MRFQPKQEHELRDVLPKGIYTAEVFDAQDTKSKAGNDMIKLNLRVYHNDGKVLLNDYLIEDLAYKIRHFCVAAGILDVYERGELSAADCKNHTIQVRLTVKKSEEYGDQNNIADYVVPKDGNSAKDESLKGPSAAQQQASRDAAAENDDLPF